MTATDNMKSSYGFEKMSKDKEINETMTIKPTQADAWDSELKGD